MTKMIATWADEEAIKVQIKMGVQQKEQVYSLYNLDIWRKNNKLNDI